MERRQILQNLFGDSEEEEAGLKDELSHQANPVFDEGPEHENKGKFENKGEDDASRRVVPKGVHHDHPGSSRSPDNEKGQDTDVILQDVFGDSDNETNEEIVSPEYTGVCAEGSHVESVEPDEEDKTYACDEEGAETEVAPFDVFEIPFRHPPAAPEQMATMRLSNLIGVDPKPFDPVTYVDEEIYVTDESGLKRCIPHTNIIRWREVKKPDGTISVESNSRFVTWSDGSTQLLIGNEAFDISEQNAHELQSHLFLRHGKGIYQSQGKIHRKMKFMPSSITSNSHRGLSALVQSRNKKVNKVRQYTPEMDPERMVEQIEKVERQTSRASKKLDKKKKKVANKYKPMGRKERELTPGFLENEEDYEQKLDELPATMHQLDLDLEKEAKAEKRIMNAKKGKKVAANSGEGAEPYEDSDVDAEMSKPKGKSKQRIESDEDTPPRKSAAGRRRRQLTISYDGNDE